MNNEECKERPEIININSKEPSFYPYSIKINKFSGSCSNIIDTYAKLCVPDVTKNITVKIFNLMSGANEIRHIKGHKVCQCRLDASVYKKKGEIKINANVSAKN